MEKVRFGLIGIGAQGGAYAGFLTGQGGFPGMPAPQCPPHCALGALCDIDPEKEKMCREKYPDVPFFKDWKEMVASGTVDAVITTVPHYLHHEIAIYCLEHGMNVLVEKPAGVRAKDVMAMNKCAEEHPDVAFGIMFNQRTNKLYQKIKEIVASGELGEIRRSNWIINTWWRPDSYYQQSEWRATWGGEGGGVLVNQAPHQLDLWQWICGIPTKVTSKNINGSHRKIDVENDVTIVTEYANGATGSFIEMFAYGFLAVLPKIIVSYVVGLGIEFVVAQWKKEEIQEGFLVSGILIPMIVPVDCPLWILAVATAFSVIFAKEVFGGTGMNVFNVALITRAFLFFAYPTKMSGDAVWVSGDSIFGLGQTVDGLTVATPLGAAATAGAYPEFSWDMVTGLIPGSIGETSVIAIALGAILLLWTGIASWKTMFSVFVGGAFMGWVFNTIGPDTAMAQMPWYEHLVLGGFCFGAVFMATDPVTSARTETGKYIFGFLIGAMAIIIRVLNPGYPEGMMLAILLMNIFAPLIDYCVVQGNISRREKRAIKSNN